MNQSDPVFETNELEQTAHVDLPREPRAAGISVVGLGKIGACLAAFMADRGQRVVGFDLDTQVVDAFNRYQPTVTEPGLIEVCRRNRERLTATAEVERAIAATDSTFIIVPTPSRANGEFLLDHLNRALGAVGRAVRGKDQNKHRPHLIVVTSTVLPGSMSTTLIPSLEEAVGRQCGRGLHVCYSPLLVSLGSIFQDFASCRLMLIGQATPSCGDRLESVYRSIGIDTDAIVRTSLQNAEISKLAINTFVTMKISFANMLSELCEHFATGDVDHVTDSVGRDHRIGRRFLTGATSYGGPCFPRDNRALAAVLAKAGLDSDLPTSIDHFNRSHSDRLVERIRSTVEPGAQVAVAGLAYKLGTDCVEGSAGVAVSKDLARAGYRVTVFDSVAIGPSRRVLGSSVRYASDLVECLGSDALVLMLPLAEIESLHEDDFQNPLFLFDCWRSVPRAIAACPTVTYLPSGIGLSRDELGDTVSTTSTAA